MDAWLRRHAVFVTAIAGALYEAGGDARRLAANAEGVGTFILAVREGWSALDRRGVKSAPLALRTIFCWAPLPYAVGYKLGFPLDPGENKSIRRAFTLCLHESAFERIYVELCT